MNQALAQVRYSAWFMFFTIASVPRAKYYFVVASGVHVAFFTDAAARLSAWEENEALGGRLWLADTSDAKSRPEAVGHMEFAV